MKTEPQPSDKEVLAGLVECVTYQNAENGFCVIRVKAEATAIWSRSSATPR
jgi:exodeoxyribonuclease V alpha subunit